MTDERQKKTSEEYRSNWDTIFKKKQPKVIETVEERYCCDGDCNQGRNCPVRNGVKK